MTMERLVHDCDHVHMPAENKMMNGRVPCIMVYGFANKTPGKYFFGVMKNCSREYSYSGMKPGAELHDENHLPI